MALTSGAPARLCRARCSRQYWVSCWTLFGGPTPRLTNPPADPQSRPQPPARAAHPRASPHCAHTRPLPPWLPTPTGRCTSQVRAHAALICSITALKHRRRWGHSARLLRCDGQALRDLRQAWYASTMVHWRSSKGIGGAVDCRNGRGCGACKQAQQQLGDSSGGISELVGPW